MATPQTAPKLSATDQAIRQLRNPSPFRGFAAALFSGAFNGATAFGAARFQNDQLDIFEEAAQAPKGSKDIRNNFLGKDQKPIVDIYPRAVGVYVGDFGVGAEKVATIIHEHGQLVIEQENTVILRQPLLTVPSGIGFTRAVAAAAQHASPDAPVAARDLFAEQFGPVTATGLFELPENTVFEKSKELVAYIELTDEALTYLRAIATNIPAYGAVIGIAVYGIAEYKVGTTR